jgi:hypothetical protein|eukprot:COSAG01_NODE_4949_length_4597_cov_2.576478_5_plen_71_part_00
MRCVVAAVAAGNGFGDTFPREWGVAPRLREFNFASVSTAMDWHFGMMNDVQRNQAYKIALEETLRNTSGA